MSSYLCPKGHASATDDFCDTCGAKMGGGPASVSSAPVSSAPTVAAAPAAAGCPNCSAPASAGRFCENCGYDTQSGRLPAMTAPVTGQWTATVGPDRQYFDANAIEGVRFPEDAAARTVTLTPPQVRIGRRSASAGTDPELDLGAAPLDPGVSHSHALLTLNIDGVWLLCDLNSTNGTYLNDEPKPLPAGQTRPLADGDRVHVGAWTTITLHAPAV